MIKLTCTNGNDSITVHLEGELDTPASIKIQDEIDRIAAIGDRDIVVDLSQLSYIASAGLRQLLALRKASLDHNTKLTLTGVQPAVMTVLKVTNFDKIFNIGAVKK